MTMKKITLTMLICLLCLPLWAAHQPEFSTAGFFRLENTGRDVYSMNPAWRFYKGAAQGADAKEFNDKDWMVVSCHMALNTCRLRPVAALTIRGSVVSQAFYTRRRFERKETIPAFRSNYGEKQGVCKR